jgi:hypothetical protein
MQKQAKVAGNSVLKKSWTYALASFDTRKNGIAKGTRTAKKTNTRRQNFSVFD